MTGSDGSGIDERRRREATARDAEQAHRIEGLSVPEKARKIVARRNAGAPVTAEVMVAEFLRDDA
jgi:hypothetical protein